LVCDIKGNEVTRGWRKLHNEELHNILFAKYKQNDQVKENEMGMACSTSGEEDCIYDSDGKARRKETTRKIET
jgi:hypothetical protein